MKNFTFMIDGKEKNFEVTEISKSVKSVGAKYSDLFESCSGRKTVRDGNKWTTYGKDGSKMSEKIRQFNEVGKVIKETEFNEGGITLTKIFEYDEKNNISYIKEIIDGKEEEQRFKNIYDGELSADDENFIYRKFDENNHVIHVIRKSENIEIKNEYSEDGICIKSEVFKDGFITSSFKLIPSCENKNILLSVTEDFEAETTGYYIDEKFIQDGKEFTVTYSVGKVE